jgi:hypothetical protein
MKPQLMLSWLTDYNQRLSRACTAPIVYIGPYGKTSELTNPPTVVVNKHAKIVFFN